MIPALSHPQSSCQTPIFPRRHRGLENSAPSAVAASRRPRQSSAGVIACIQVFYEGNVQGVGFRYTAKQIATGFDVTGAVRNLPDGRVELHATGEVDEVRAFLDAIEQSALRAHIKRRSETELPNPPDFYGFEIRHD